MTQGRTDEEVARLQEACRRAGVKLTHQRLEIFREVLSSHEHPDADAVYRAVQRRLPTVSLDTVYRTLALLAELGFVTTLGPRRESVRYDANLAPHHHFVCERCGMARDFESAELSTLALPAEVRRLGEVTALHLEVRGICAACARHGAGAEAGPAR
jgi:Fur family peroxide stress response transcriptional regulator